MLNMFLKGIAKFPPILIFDTPRQQELRSNAYQKLIQLVNKTSQNSQIIICVSEDIPLDQSQYNLIEILNGELILG